MTINGFASEDDVGSLGWIDALKEMFKFQAVWSTVEFWQVRHQLGNSLSPSRH
jgi:hypothetical protein